MRWFKHDSNANADSKLQNVLLDYGLDGYGLYWYCIELIAGKVDADNITFSLEHDARIIARNTGSTPQKVEEMMRYFVKVGLFENANGVITCLKMARRLDQSMTSNKAMRAIIDQIKKPESNNSPKDGGMESESHDLIMTESDFVMQEEIRLEEIRKEKKKPVSTSLDFSSWPCLPNEQLMAEWKQLRKRLKAGVTQTVVNRTGKELHIAVKAGFTVDQCFEQWIYKGWRGFEAEWLISARHGQNSAQSAPKPREFSQ